MCRKRERSVGGSGDEALRFDSGLYGVLFCQGRDELLGGLGAYDVYGASSETASGDASAVALWLLCGYFDQCVDLCAACLKVISHALVSFNHLSSESLHIFLEEGFARS